MKRNLFFVTIASLFIWATLASAAEETSVFDQFEAVIALEKKEVKALIEKHEGDDSDLLIKELSREGLVSLGGAFVIVQSLDRAKEIEKEISDMSLSAEEKTEELVKQIDQMEEDRYQKLLEIDFDMLPQEKRDFIQTWIEEYKQHQEEKENRKQLAFEEDERDEVLDIEFSVEEETDVVADQIAEVVQRMVEDPTKADQEELEQVLEDAGIQEIIEEHDDDNNEAALAAKLIAAGVGVGAVALLVKKSYNRKKKAGKVNIKKQMLSERLVARSQKEVRYARDSVDKMNREKTRFDHDQEKSSQSEKKDSESGRERSDNKEVSGRDSKNAKRRGLLEKLKDRKRKVVVKGREKKTRASVSVRSIRSKVQQVQTNMQNKKSYKFKK